MTSAHMTKSLLSWIILLESWKIRFCAYEQTDACRQATLNSEFNSVPFICVHDCAYVTNKVSYEYYLSKYLQTILCLRPDSTGLIYYIEIFLSYESHIAF